MRILWGCLVSGNCSPSPSLHQLKICRISRCCHPRLLLLGALHKRSKEKASRCINLSYCHGAGPGARFGFGCLISLLMLAARSGCLDLGKSVVTSLRMSRSWKECHHLAPDVSILERVSVTGPGCIREGCMSCVVMSTYVSMITYVSCAGMSRRTYGSCENCVYKEGVSRVFSSSSRHATSCILFGISTLLPFPPFPLIPSFRRSSSSAARPCPTRASDAVRHSVRHVRLMLSVPVRHLRPTLSVSLFDTSVRRCPSPCPTRPSDVVRSCPTRPSDAVRLCLPFPFPFPFPSRSRSRSCSRFFPVPVPVPAPASAPAHACVTRTHSSTLENRRHYTRLHLLF